MADAGCEASNGWKEEDLATGFVFGEKKSVKNKGEHNVYLTLLLI